MDTMSLEEKSGDKDETRDEVGVISSDSVEEKEGVSKSGDREIAEDELKKKEQWLEVMKKHTEKRIKEQWRDDAITVRELKEGEEVNGFAVYGHEDGITLKLMEDNAVNHDRFDFAEMKKEDTVYDADLEDGEVVAVVGAGAVERDDYNGGCALDEE